LTKHLENGRQENSKYQARIESIQKDINIHRIQIKNEETKKAARIEAAELNMLIDSSMGIDFAPVGIPDIQGASKEDVERVYNTLKDRLKTLQIKEDEFNRNAAMVPESDPNIAIINDKIQALKDSV